MENFFGVQRQRGRTGEKPNVSQFCKNTQALRVINSVCGNVSKGNCRGWKQSIDMKDTKPLPKRRRIRQSASHNTGESPLLDDNTACLTPVPQLESSPPASSVQTVKSSAQSAVVKSSLSVQSIKSLVPLAAVKSSSIQPDKSLVQPAAVKSSSIQPDKSLVQPAAVKSSSIQPDKSLVQPAAVKSLSVQPVKSPLPRDSLVQAFEPLPTPPPQVDSSLSTLSEANNVISKHCGIVLQHQDLHTLDNLNWLNDQVAL